MSGLSDPVRQIVRQRAGNFCEYCLSHQDYIMGRLQVDRILPVAKGGSDELENLCLSRWAEINAPETISEEKLSFPRRRESTVYRRGTKSAINYVHLLSL